MTTKRWIDASSDASELERSVLASGLAADPPAGAERAVWQSLAVALVAAPVPDVAGASSPCAASAAGAAKLSGTATLATLGKGFVLGVGVSLVAAGIGRLERPPSRETPRAVVAPTAVGKPARAVVTPEVNPRPVLPRPQEPTAVAEVARAASPPPATLAPPRSPAVPPAPAVAKEAGGSSVAAFPAADLQAASRASRLEEEAAMLRRARSELHAGRLAEAFATLEASREKFSLPELAQEREALLIELLLRSGQRASAVEKARSFLSRYPESPHAAKVRSIAGVPP